MNSLFVGLLSIAISSSTNQVEEFFRAGCLFFGRCEELISAVQKEDSSKLRCISSPDLEKIVRHPDQASKVVRSQLDSFGIGREKSPGIWMGYVGLASALGGRFQDTVLRVLSENSHRLNGSTKLQLGASLGLGSYLFYVKKRSEFDRDVRMRSLSGNPYIRMPQNKSGSGDRETELEDSLFAWYGDRLLWDSLVHSFSSGVFYSRRKGDSSGKVYGNLLDSSLEKVAANWRAAMYPGPLSSHLDACIGSGKLRHCEYVRSSFEELRETCRSPDSTSKASIIYRATSMQDLFIIILRRKESLGEISVSSITILREISIGLRVPESQKLLFLHIRSKNPIYEDRENFPQVEMPPVFAIWFYADPVKSKSQTVESRVPKLLALTAAEQMACLRDTTKANCGEIRDFVRETAGWGGAESVKPFKFLIRPMTRKPPGWK